MRTHHCRRWEPGLPGSAACSLPVACVPAGSTARAPTLLAETLGGCRAPKAGALEMSETAASDPTQALHEEIAAVQKDLGAQVHQVKSEVGQMRAEMRQEMAELRKEMREVMACIGQLMEK